MDYRYTASGTVFLAGLARPLLFATGLIRRLQKRRAEAAGVI